MRRLVFLLAAGPLAALACSSSNSDQAALTPDAGDTRPPTPTEWDRAVTRTDEATAAKDRTACKFTRGAMPAETLGKEIPVDKDLPIETVVLMMQENRSFDHYFGRYPKWAKRSDVEVAPDDASNPESTGATPGASFPWTHAEHLCFKDTGHGWRASHREWNDGKMNGFYEANHDPKDPLENGARAMWWYDEREIPFYYALAAQFGLADHYHCSLLGPTWPNRMFFYAGTSFGLTFNTFPNIASYTFPDKDAVLLDELEKRHVDWKIYTAGGPPGVQVAIGPTLTTRFGRDVTLGTLEDFKADAAAGKLPPFVYVEANALNEGKASGNDEHPESTPQVGQKLVYDVVSALTRSPQWNKMAFFLTYDEHGGLYDHLPPPEACPPDNIDPILDKGDVTQGKFDRLGVRVPLIVVSPYTKKGYVSHAVYDHTSVLRFVQAKFKLPALTSRDANASIPIDFFDFASPPNLAPPSFPEPVIDPDGHAYCAATFAP